MEPHTGPFTLTHTPAGCPLTRTPLSPLTSTYPPPTPHPHPTAPPPSSPKYTASARLNHVPSLLAAPSLCQYDYPQLRREERTHWCPGRAAGLGATELCVCVWCLYDCRQDPEVLVGRPVSQPHLR